MGLETARWLLAHQGGWDELLMFGIPVVLAILAVRWAERRGRRRNAEAEEPVELRDEREDAGH